MPMMSRGQHGQGGELLRLGQQAPGGALDGALGLGALAPLGALKLVLLPVEPVKRVAELRNVATADIFRPYMAVCAYFSIVVARAVFPRLNAHGGPFVCARVF